MAITYTSKTNSARSNSAPSTFTHTCDTGSRLLVLTLVIGETTARAGGAPTYNGVTLTQADSYRSAEESTVEMWYLVDPPTGTSYTVSIPNTGTVYITAEASNYTPSSGNKILFESANYTSGISINPTGPIHSNVRVGSLIIAIMGFGQDTPDWSENYSRLYYEDGGAYSSGSQYMIYSGLDAFLKWITSTSEDWVIVSAVFGEYADIGAAVGASKANLYSVLQEPEALNVSKGNVYSVLSEVPGDTTITKSIGYTVLSQLPGQSNIAKSVGYVVLGPINNSYPMFWVF
jgi:hypothetical protein